MKQLLLHGPAKGASRKKLIEIKQKFDPNNVIVFEEGTDIKTILDNLSSQSLFTEERLVIVENPSEDFITYTLNPNPFTLVLWFDHEVNSKKPILQSALKSKAQILFFPEAKEISVFPFLDYLTQGDKKAYLELQKLKEAGYDFQYLSTMVFYLLRNLVNTPKNAPQFVRDKLQRQRTNFDLGRIINLYKQVIELDFKIKSGLLEKDQAEFLLVNKFIEYPHL